MSPPILQHANDMLAGVMPILQLTFLLLACGFVVSLAAGMIHYNMTLHSTGDLRYARQCRRDTMRITGMICASLCFSGMALYTLVT